MRTFRPRFRSPWHAAVCTGFLLLSACSDGSGEPPTEPTQRRFLDAEWTPVFAIRSGVNDTVFQYLSDVGMGRDQVYALDLYANRVIAFDTLGHPLWSTGRQGDGPGEFRGPQTLELAPDGRIWVFDPDAGRLTVLSPNGEPLETILLTGLPATPSDITVLAPDSILVAVGRQPEPFWILDGSGHVRTRLPHPMGLFKETDPFARQMWIASDPASPAWAAGFIMTNGFVTFRGSEPAAWGWYPEPIQPPEVVRSRTSEGERTVSTTRLATAPTIGALDLVVTDSTVLVLFSGRSERRFRIIDVYNLDDGAYRGTIPLPWPAATMARYGDRFVFMYNKPTPAIWVARLRLNGGG